jgi:hypothetical protein
MIKYIITFVAGVYCGQTYNLPNIEHMVNRTMYDIARYIENAKKK